MFKKRCKNLPQIFTVTVFFVNITTHALSFQFQFFLNVRHDNIHLECTQRFEVWNNLHL